MCLWNRRDRDAEQDHASQFPCCSLSRFIDKENMFLSTPLLTSLPLYLDRSVRTHEMKYLYNDKIQHLTLLSPAQLFISSNSQQRHKTLQSFLKAFCFKWRFLAQPFLEYDGELEMIAKLWKQFTMMVVRKVTWAHFFHTLLQEPQHIKLSKLNLLTVLVCCCIVILLR